MDELPDISDLLQIRKGLLDSQEKLRILVREYKKKSDGLIDELREEIVRRYKAANITEDNCDHPIARHCGQGENECECCGKALY